MWQDKRFLLTLLVLVAVLALHAIGKPPGDQILSFVGLTLGGFVAQSQLGQTKRALAAMSNAAPTPAS